MSGLRNTTDFNVGRSVDCWVWVADEEWLAVSGMVVGRGVDSDIGRSSVRNDSDMGRRGSDLRLPAEYSKAKMKMRRMNWFEGKRRASIERDRCPLKWFQTVR